MSNISLEEILNAHPDGGNLLHDLENIKAKAEPLLSKIIETFPNYTAHDIGHSERVIRTLDFVIPGPLKEQLNKYEIYFLIASAYLHDIGMVNFPKLAGKKKLEEFKGKIPKRNHEICHERTLRNYIRENHHLRSEEFIISNFKDLAIEDEHQARIIGRICRGHRRENLSNRLMFKYDGMYKNYPINIPLLSAFLRIADELDLTFERTPQVVYDHVPPKEPISDEEWKKHLSISGVGLSPEEHTIKCTVTCKSPKIHRALKNLEVKIDEELEDLPNHLHHYRLYRIHLPREFLMDISPEGYKYYDFRFSLQEKEIMNLLMGERIYESRKESLRELLKNSVDSCRYRKKLLKKNGLSYNPEIIFEISPDGDVIIVTDNGIGMDEDIIERYFTKIGRSFYRSPDFLEKDVDFTPVSELGIGILSCFMIANKVVVETKTDNNKPLLIEIDDISDYFFVKEGKRKKVGTTITLVLKEDVGEQIDLAKEIKYYARHLEFPVKVILSNGKDVVVEDAGFEPDIGTFLSESELDTEKHDFHLVKIDETFLEGIIALFLEKDPELDLKPTDKYLGSHGGYKYILSNEGIFIGNINILPQWISQDKVFFDLNLKKNTLDLNLARNNIIYNEKLHEIKKFLEKTLINDFKYLLRTLELKMETKGIYSPHEVINIFLMDYLSPFKPTLGWSLVSYEVLDLIRDFYYFRLISKNGIEYVKYDNIVNNRKICILDDLYGYDIEYICQILSVFSGFAEDYSFLLSEDYISQAYAKYLFPDIQRIHFFSYIDMEKSDELRGMIPKTWDLVRFTNFKTDRLIEFSRYSYTFVNGDNRFIKLLIESRNVLTDDKKIAVEGFFRSLKLDLKHDFQRVLTRQKAILEWFVDAGEINENEIEYYMLTRNDFAPHLLRTSD